METTADQALISRAGHLVDRHAMCWMRNLAGPIDEVWQAVSTLEGLKKWWLAGTVKKFELQEGGVFDHHWTNMIQGYREFEYIDLREARGSYAGTGGMRFELARVDDGTTLFMFLDTWGPDVVAEAGEGGQREQPGGPGTPWPGVAAGWHSMIDGLEKVISGASQSYSYEDLCTFYLGYLRDMHRWRDMVARR